MMHVKSVEAENIHMVWKFGEWGNNLSVVLIFWPWLKIMREIGSRVGRNQTTVMRLCDHWMQESKTDRRGRSHPPQCTTSLSTRTIRRRLQQSGLSARRPLLSLPLTQNHRRLHRQWSDERRMWVAE
ncbi:transposable element Tcb1 transposase [Trichonephila clavipes]|nr:transposable element Tcb1 transposase [Trichonephila clavipes]